MHEMAICMSLIDQIEDAGRSHGFRKVDRVRLEIGRFAGVETEALAFGFEVARKDTICDGAALEIIPLPGRAWCFTCETQVELEDRLDPCPACGGGRLQANGGDELRIKDLEVT